MFVDASAIIAIISGEDDATALGARLARAQSVFVSPMVIYEATLGLARRRACSLGDAEDLVGDFVHETQAVTIPIDDGIAQAAIRAFDLYGKGRHKADLNMGDCFAYACAKSLNLPVLFKGNDFAHTDIPVG